MNYEITPRSDLVCCKLFDTFNANILREIFQKALSVARATQVTNVLIDARGMQAPFVTERSIAGWMFQEEYATHLEQGGSVLKLAILAKPKDVQENITPFKSQAIEVGIETRICKSESAVLEFFELVEYAC